MQRTSLGNIAGLRREGEGQNGRNQAKGPQILRISCGLGWEIPFSELLIDMK
jgi:hypothetical protein